jgi:hypothetical protein
MKNNKPRFLQAIMKDEVENEEGKRYIIPDKWKNF